MTSRRRWKPEGGLERVAGALDELLLLRPPGPCFAFPSSACATCPAAGLGARVLPRSALRPPHHALLDTTFSLGAKLSWLHSKCMYGSAWWYAAAVIGRHARLRLPALLCTVDRIWASGARQPAQGVTCQGVLLGARLGAGC